MFNNLSSLFGSSKKNQYTPKSNLEALADAKKGIKTSSSTSSFSSLYTVSSHGDNMSDVLSKSNEFSPLK